MISFHSLQSLQKSQIAHQKVLELRKTTRQALAEVETKTTELKESHQKTAEQKVEVARLSGLVTSAEADKQKALIVMKDKYLRELVKLEGKKDAEIAELKKKVSDANAEGFKEAEGLYIPQCEGAKDLFFKCGWRSVVEQLGCGPETEVYNAPQYFIPASLAEYAASVQQQFLQGSDDENEEIEPTVTPVVNEQGNDQSARLEPTVEDLTVEPSTDIVLPVATETDLLSTTGVQVDIDADLEDLFT